MYKRIVAVLLLSALLCVVCVPGCACAEETKSRKLTVMVYMCGSNLESEYGNASHDLRQMMNSGFPEDEMSVLVMIGGSRLWRMDRNLNGSMILELHRDNQYQVVREYEEPMNMAESGSLTDLLVFGRENYPAEDYALIIWDHGGGPLCGTCLDELYSPDVLFLQELTESLRQADYPEKLSWIGFDACFMGSAEVAFVLSPYAGYMIASQDAEPPAGWNYAFLKNASGDGMATGSRIVSSYHEALPDDDSLTLSCIRLDKMDVLVAEMDTFFASLDSSISNETFASLSRSRFASSCFGIVVRAVGSDGHDLVDLGDLVLNCGKENAALIAALKEAVVCVWPDDGSVSGLSVYHPYLNKQKYLESWRKDYQRLGFSDGYARYVEHFGSILTGEEYIDWSRMVTKSEGVDTDGINTFSLQLTKEQAANFLSGELVILRRYSESSGTVSVYPVAASEASVDENGLLTASYSGEALYAVDDNGKILAPISFVHAENSEYYQVEVWYEDYSFSESARGFATVVCMCSLDPETRELKIVRRYPYDPVSGTFTKRVSFDEDGYTHLYFNQSIRDIPDTQASIPGFDEWKAYKGYHANGFTLPRSWHLQLVDGWNSDELLAMFQVTDVRQNVWSSVPVRTDNPREKDIDVTWTATVPEGLYLSFAAVQCETDLNPCLKIRIGFLNGTDDTVSIQGSEVILNGSRTTAGTIGTGKLEPRKSEEETYYLHDADLTGLTHVDSADFTLTVSAVVDDAKPVEIPVHLEFTDCSVAGLAPDAPVVLDEFREESVVWQLVSLRQDPDGAVSGLLHVENQDTEPLKLSGSLYVNGVSSEDTLSVRLAPGTDAYLPFSMANGDYLYNGILKLDDSLRLRFLPVSQALEQSGIAVADQVDLYFGLNVYTDPQEVRHISLRMPEGVPLDDALELPAPSVLLDDRGITVSLERVMIADNGVGLGLRLRNDTDEYVCLSVYNPVLYGQETGSLDLSSWDKSIVLPPDSGMVLCESVLPDDGIPGNVPVEELRLTFQAGNLLTTPAVIRFPEGTAFGEKNGTELFAEELDVTPAVFRDEPMVLDETVRVSGSPVYPVLAEAPVSAEQMERIESGTVSLCVVSYEEGSDPDAPASLVTRTISRASLEKKDGKWLAVFSGLAVCVQDHFLYTLETQLTDTVWQFEPESVCFYPELFDVDTITLSLLVASIPTDHWTSKISLDVGIVGNAADVTRCEASLFDYCQNSRSARPRSNVYLSEVVDAAMETWVHFGTVLSERIADMGYHEVTRLSLDEPVSFSLIPCETIPGDKGLYYALNYADGSREDILVDLASGEVLDRTFTPAERNPFSP